MRTRQKAKFQQYRQKHAKQWRCAGILLGIGFAYYLLIQFTPFHLFCLFQRITKLACPGCGITHFLVRLLHSRRCTGKRCCGRADPSLGAFAFHPCYLASEMAAKKWPV